MNRIMDNLHRAESINPRPAPTKPLNNIRLNVVDWLVDVHATLKCRPENLYRAVDIFDADAAAEGRPSRRGADHPSPLAAP